MSSSTTLAEDAYRTIKQQILRLELAPGSGFTESELAGALGLSKTPVREALARLQRDHLVQVMARSGYRVTPITLKGTRDLFGLRTILEAEASALAAANFEDAARLHDLDVLCRSSYRSDEPASVSTFLEQNTRFHTTIAELSGNERLAAVLKDVLEQLERLFYLGLTLTSRAVEIEHEHTDLVAAILASDSAAARDIAIAQARSSQKMVVDALLTSDALATTNLVPVPSGARKRAI